MTQSGLCESVSEITLYVHGLLKPQVLQSVQVTRLYRNSVTVSDALSVRQKRSNSLTSAQ